MHIRKTTSKVKNKIYENYLLVESVMTPKGPRQRTICSLRHLKPRPRKEWLLLAQKVETALKGQLTFEKEEPEVEEIVKKAKAFEAQEKRALKDKDDDVISIHTDKVQMERAREAGPVHAGYQFWKKLKMDEILKQAGFSEKTRLLTLLMVMNRLVAPSSEYQMPDWVNYTALSDILSVDLASLNDDALYRNLDKLYPKRGIIESLLTEKEKSLFDLDDTIYLYDLTSIYFEGECLLNSQAKRGYSRDKRFDAKQVVVGLVIDRDGVPKAHEIFSGNRKDCTTLDEMLDILEKRVPERKGTTVVVDRGMAFQSNIDEIKEKGYHYIVATRQQEKNQYLDEFENRGFHPLLRSTSSANPTKKKSGVFIKKMEQGDELYVLCII